jgi:hypothetical protein
LSFLQQGTNTLQPLPEFLILCQPLLDPGQGGADGLVVPGIQEDGMPAATVRDVVPGVGVFDAEWSGHERLRNEGVMKLNVRLEPYAPVLHHLAVVFLPSSEIEDQAPASW